VRRWSWIALSLLGVATVPGRSAHASPWELSATAYQFFVTDGRDFLQPTLAADRGSLHTEFRYNYEGLDSGSGWVGYTWRRESSVALELTPMLGAVVGSTIGVAPGYGVLVSWRGLMLYTEGEYVIDMADDDDSFFYSWSELTVSFSGAVHTGVALQRTRTHESPREFEPGFTLGVDLDRWGAGVYVFDPDREPTVALAVYAEL
jgi:hypothetical protein